MIRIIYILCIIIKYLGSIATGGVPSPFDRSFALKEGQIAVKWIENIQDQCPSVVKSPSSAVLLGLIKNDYKLTNLEDLKPFVNQTYAPIYIPT